MLKRVHGYLIPRNPDDAPAASRELERRGFTLLEGVLDEKETKAISADIERVFREYPCDQRAAARSEEDDEMFRYEMLNRSAACQRIVGDRRILDVIEPLLGEDCHVIANTAWRNPAGHPGSHGGQRWHIDAGPHIPLPEGVRWPAEIPHPVFAIGTHIYLRDCRLDDGPTGAIPGSHLSGRFPPPERSMDDDLDYEGQRVVPILARAGDVALFVSDVWHRRMPTGENDNGRFFLQVHYGRRDIAQRLKTTRAVNQLSDEAVARANEDREKTLAGLHPPRFYDG